MVRASRNFDIGHATAAILALALAAGTAGAQPAALGRHGVDPERITVSGISSGGYMAMQLGIAFSGVFSGVGAFAAGPYGCAETGGGANLNARRALGPCMAGRYEPPQRWWCAVGFSTCPGADGPDAAASAELARRMQAEQRIDPLSNLARQRVFLLSGAEDRTVHADVVAAAARFYESLAPGARVEHVRRPGLAHTFPTPDYAGNACKVSAPPFVSDCDFDGAQRVLEHLHGPLAPHAAGAIPPATAFDQRPFVAPGTQPGMAEVGYVYVPAACASSPGCGLHVALHGCRQAASEVGNAFVDGAGFNRWAEANRLIVLYPQVKKTEGLFSANPRGCWDWWGYTGEGFGDRRGAQLRAIAAMVDRLSGPPSP